MWIYFCQTPLLPEVESSDETNEQDNKLISLLFSWDISDIRSKLFGVVPLGSGGHLLDGAGVRRRHWGVVLEDRRGVHCTPRLS